MCYNTHDVSGHAFITKLQCVGRRTHASYLSVKVFTGVLTKVLVMSGSVQLYREPPIMLGGSFIDLAQLLRFCIKKQERVKDAATRWSDTFGPDEAKMEA